MRTRPGGHSRRPLLSLALAALASGACDSTPPITSLEDVPFVSAYVNAPVAGGFAGMYFSNRTERPVTADICDVRLEHRGPLTGQQWRTVVDDRPPVCGAGTTVLEPGGSVPLRVPIPVDPGEYRVALTWEDGTGKRFETVNIPFAIPDEEAVAMRLASFVHGDTVRVQFINRSSRPWTIDVCDGIRFEAFRLGRFYFADVGDRPEPCGIPAITLHAGPSVTLGVPRPSNANGVYLRLRAGFRGPFGEIEVRWSGEFTIEP